MPPVRISMGDSNWPARHIYCFQSRTFGRMAHIYHQPHPVHLCYGLNTKSGQPCIILFITSCCQQRLVIIGQLHKARAKLIDNFNQANIIFNRRTILKAVENCCSASLCGYSHIIGCPAMHQPVRVGFDMTVPANHIFNCLAEIFMIADGYMNRT